MTKLKHIINAIVFSMIALSSTTQAAETPFIIPTGPGGLYHKITLDLAPGITTALGNPFVVEYKPGAMGTVAIKSLMDDKRSQMVLLLNAAQPESPYDQLTDIVPLVELGSVSVSLSANPALKAKTLADLIKNPPTKPVSIGFANGGVHIYWFRELAKVYPQFKFTEVPFRTGAEITTALGGGHLDLGIITPAAAQALESENKAVSILAIGPSRMSILPNVPTAREQGIRFEYDTVGFSHIFLWADPGADKFAVDNFRKRYATWARSQEGQEAYRKADMNVEVKNIERPENTLKKVLKKSYPTITLLCQRKLNARRCI